MLILEPWGKFDVLYLSLLEADLAILSHMLSCIHLLATMLVWKMLRSRTEKTENAAMQQTIVIFNNIGCV